MELKIDDDRRMDDTRTHNKQRNLLQGAAHVNVAQKRYMKQFFCSTCQGHLCATLYVESATSSALNIIVIVTERHFEHIYSPLKGSTTHRKQNKLNNK